MIYENVVIGTGLSSLSVVMALLRRDKKVLVLDPGIRLDRDRTNKIIDYKKIHSNNFKTYYGNKLVTELKEKEYILSGIASNSLVYGGLSNIWGASLSLEAPNNNDKHICFNNHEYIKEILEWMPIKYSEKVDFSGYQIRDDEIQQSIHAINIDKCKNDNMCLYGCSNGAIFNASDEFDKLVISKKIKLISGFKVINLFEGNHQVTIHGDKENIIAKRCFISAGPTNTAKIILSSVKDIESVIIKDSQYFILPVIWSKKISDQIKNNYSPSFANLSYKVGTHDLRAQLYGMSIYLDNQIKHSNKLTHKLLKIANNMKYRIGMIQSFLPSEESGSILIKKNINNHTINKYSSYSTEYMDLTLRMLKQNILKINSYTLERRVLIPPIMSGYHFGSSFPISDDGKNTSAGYLGRLKYFKKVHICDSSILPRIPSFSPTLSVMANCVRIVSEICK